MEKTIKNIENLLKMSKNRQKYRKTGNSVEKPVINRQIYRKLVKNVEKPVKNHQK